MMFRHLERTKNLLCLSACHAQDFNRGVTSNPVNSHLRGVLPLSSHAHFTREQADSEVTSSLRETHARQLETRVINSALCIPKHEV